MASLLSALQAARMGLEPAFLLTGQAAPREPQAALDQLVLASPALLFLYSLPQTLNALWSAHHPAVNPGHPCSALATLGALPILQDPPLEATLGALTPQTPPSQPQGELCCSLLTLPCT